MKKYAVSKYFSIPVTIFICSIFLICYSVVGNYRYHHPVEVNKDNLKDLSGNQYVRMEIDHYLVRKDGGHVSQVYLAPKEYWTYNVEMEEGMYVQLGICDIDTIRKLEGFTEGYGEKLVLLGRIVPPATDNPAWYDGVEGFQREALYKDRQIYQISPKEAEAGFDAWIKYGCAGLLVAVILFFFTAGIQRVYEKPFEETNRFKEWAVGRNYSLESDLQREMNRLEELRQQQTDNRKKIIFGILAVAAGFFVMLNVMMQTVDRPNIVLKMIGAGVLFAWCLRFLCKALLNSGLKSALKISELFLLTTIPVEIEETIKIIAILHQRIKDEKKSYSG